MLRNTVIALVVALTWTSPAAADVSVLAGNWIGEVDSDRGRMEIMLRLNADKGGLVGVLKTGHGDWQIDGITEKDGVFTIELKTPGGAGRMTGHVKDTTFSGEWRAPMAIGTFELTRSKK